MATFLDTAKPISLTSRDEALEQVEATLAAVDQERKAIAKIYAGAPSHSSIENALGESLTFIRKAIEKLHKARTDLMQDRLGM